MPASAKISVKAETSIPADPLALLIKAYEEVVQKEKKEWVRLSDIGIALKEDDAQFRPAVYGHKDLQALVSAYPDQLETRRQASKGKPLLVRWKSAPSS